MQLLLIILLTSFSAAQSNLFDESIDLPWEFFNKAIKAMWNGFKSEFKKDYNSTAEEIYRMKVFMENRRTVMEHNAKYAIGLTSFKMGLNEFSDMHISEIQAVMTGLKDETEDKIEGSRRSVGAKFISPANVELPKSIDWRKLGAVTPVKHQHQCGSCWAFAATGSLEGQVYRKEGYLVSLSEQNLMDCSNSYGNKQCSTGGGSPEWAYQYVKDNGGINSEKTYGYVPSNDTCRFDKQKVAAKVTGYVRIDSDGEEKLKAAVGTVGPVAVSLRAIKAFSLYAEGIFEDAECVKPKVLNHGVLAVGYGTDENGKDYWIIKNSWGRSFGNKGYINIIRNKNQHCGLGRSALYPLV